VEPLTLALWAIRLAFLAALYLFLALVVGRCSGTSGPRPGIHPGRWGASW